MRDNQTIRWSVILFATLALAACGNISLPIGGNQPAVQEPSAVPANTPEASTATPVPTPITLDATLRFEEGGFSLDYPQSWYTEHASNTLVLATNQQAVAAITPGDNLVLLIDSTPMDHVTGTYTDTADIMTSLESLFRMSSEGPSQAGYTVGETEPITIEGKVGLKADLTASGGAGQLMVLLAPPRVIRILGQASPEAWKAHHAAFEKMIASITFFVPSPTPTPTPEVVATQPVLTTRGLPGFLLRIGGNEGPPDGRFVSARGLDAGSDGVVYLAESGKGLWVFAPDGKLITTFGKQGNKLLDAYDVAIGPDGDLFVADYGRNAIARFTPDGTLVRRWGEIGEGQGQFGLQSPQRIAVGLDESVYALDSRINPATQKTITSIIRFNGKDGSFVQRIDLPSGAAPNDLAVDAQGYLYLADAADGAVLKIDTTGQVLARFGDTITPKGITAGSLDIDRQGNIYIATWSDGILKLGPDGTLLARGGTVAEPGTVPRPGQLSLPNGIAAAPGDIVWVSDNTGEYNAVTALRLFTDTAAYTTTASTDDVSATMVMSESGRLHQWAVSAKASSSYGEDYGPDGAAGPPDVSLCEDSADAWAPAAPDTLDTLELDYDTPVFATQVNIHQNHQPGFVTKIELLDERGTYTTVYTGEPALATECPAVMRVSFNPSLLQVIGVKLTVDQRKDANWTEIDAVELVGVP